MNIENNFSVIKDAGHMLHIEKPNEVLAYIKKFLSEI
jgi:pimeloyl-ACP methyl ester carboxylesterase